MQEISPTFNILYNSIRNSIVALELNNNKAHAQIYHMKHLKNDGAVEYLSYGVFKNNRLDYFTWSFTGSEEAVSRCDDILFWDFTHKITKNSSKLSTFTAVDSELKSRAVLMNLVIEETKCCQMLLEEWHNLKIPAIISTDCDESMYAAILGLPYIDEITQFLSVFYLFDGN